MRNTRNNKGSKIVRKPMIFIKDTEKINELKTELEDVRAQLDNKVKELTESAKEIAELKRSSRGLV